MKVINNIKDIDVNSEAVLALGTFDGIHIAHKHVIEFAVKIAKKNNLLSVVYTFSNHPKEMNEGVVTPKRLLHPDKKIEIIKSLGVDILIMVPFDKEQINIEAEYFLKEIIVKKIKAKHIIVGYDFRFGRNANGCTNMLKEYSTELDYAIDVISPIKSEGLIISSTMIRTFLLNGNVEAANALLGRKYSITGTVVIGKQLGRKLGFPTINLNTSCEMSVLKSGVYVTNTIVNKTNYLSISNVGFNPTFNQKNFVVETHIFDFSGDLYGLEVEIVFEKYIREEKKFDFIENLVAQISSDIEYTKRFFSRNNVIK